MQYKSNYIINLHTIIFVCLFSFTAQPGSYKTHFRPPPTPPLSFFELMSHWIPYFIHFNHTYFHSDIAFVANPLTYLHTFSYAYTRNRISTHICLYVLCVYAHKM